MAEIADSFAAVWNERTTLYEQVLELRAQSTAGEATIAMLRDEVERTKADRDTLLVQLEQPDHLFGEALRPRTVTPSEREEPRKTLREMMVDALRESGLRRSERASPNGSEGADRSGELFDLQDAPATSPEPEE